MRIWITAAIAVFVFPLGRVLAQTDSYPDQLRLKSGFAPRFEVESGSITATAVDAMDRLVIAGDFDGINGVPRNRIVRFRSDLTVDETFVAPSLFPIGIRTLAVQNDGKVLVGGNFTLPGAAMPSYIVRLNEDGSLDTDFVADAAVVALPGLPAELSVQSDGKILVRYDSGQLVRLLPDGDLDPGFDFGSNLADTVSLSISGMAPHPDGHIWLRGVFRTDPEAQSRQVFRANSDGSIDLATPEIDTGIQGVFDLAIDGDGAVFIAGGFTTINGLEASYVAKLKSDGTVDPSFSASSDLDSFVRRIFVRSDGQLIVSIDTRGIVSLNPDGSLDSSYIADAGLAGSYNLIPTAVLSDGRLILQAIVAAPWGLDGRSSRLIALDASGAAEGYLVANLQKPGSVWDAIPAGDGNWYAAGSWQFVNGAAVKPLVRLDSVGSVDGTFNPTLLSHISTRVTKLARNPDGKLIAHSFADELGPEAQRNWDAEIVQLDADGNQEVVFQPILGPRSVAELAFQSDGKLVVAGAFTEYDGSSANNLARLAVSRMTPVGALDESFGFYQSEDIYNRRDSGYSVQIQPNGGILLAGSFFDAFRNGSWNVVRVLEDGTLDSSFVFEGFPPEPNIPPVYVVGGPPQDQLKLIRLQSDGRILAAVELDVYGGTYFVDRTQVTRLNADGSFDASYAVEAVFNGPISDLLLQSDGKVLVAGSFSEFAGVAVPPVVRLNSDGTLDTSFGLWDPRGELPPIERVKFIRIDEAFNVLLAVETDTYSAGLGFRENRLLLFESAGRPLIVSPPTSQTAVAGDKVTLSVGADSSEALSYQWRFNGVDLAGTNQATLTLGAAQTFQAGSYSVVVSTAEGVVESDPVSVAVSPAAASDSRLINISTRGFVGQGGSILIPGLTISGGGPKRLLIRAVGPSLEKLGVSDFLSDPKLTVFSGQTPILTNDNWGDSPEAATTAAVAAQVGAFTLLADSTDAAFVVTLPSGSYTIHVQGADGQTGVALTEVYEVPSL